MVNVTEILRAEKLRVDCPDEQDGLTLIIGGDEAPVDYENSYKIGYKVACAFCSKKTPHQWGITAVMEDGRRALCGNCCAKRLFGSDIHKKLSAELSKRERSVIARHMFGPLMDGISSVIDELEANWLPFEKQVIDANIAIVQQLPNEWRTRMNDSGNLAVKDWEGKSIGRAQGVDALTYRERYLFNGASQLFQIKTYLEADSSEDRILFAQGKIREAIKSLETGFNALRKAQKLYKTDENIVMLGLWLESRTRDQRRFVLEETKNSGSRGISVFDEYGNSTVPFVIPREDGFAVLSGAEVVLALLKEPAQTD